jgi:phosphatidyl-myo-inositol dimannoside synthase
MRLPVFWLRTIERTMMIKHPLPALALERSRVLYLATDAYGGRGGIAFYNRNAIEALLPGRENGGLIAVPRIAGPRDIQIPEGLVWRRAGGNGALRYVYESIKATLNQRPHLIYCGHVNLLPVAAFLKGMSGAKLVLGIHGFEAWSPFRRRFARLALKFVDRVFSVSDYTATRFSEWSGFPRTSIKVVPNSIDLGLFGIAPKRVDLVERYELHGREVIMLLGRMDNAERLKGFDELIEAMPLILEARPQAKLMLVGDGNDMNRLRHKAEALGLSGNFVFTGFIPESEKADHYRLADAYVMPSRQEGFGFVHLEAMACGVPTVASMADGAQEAVRGGRIGRLVDPENRQSIVKQSLAALDHPNEIPLGLEYFAMDRFAERLRKAVDDVIQN